MATTQDQTLVQERESGHNVVRTLMPVENERLQGFPDGFTDITGCDVDEVTGRVAESLGYEEGSKEFKALRRKVARWSEDCPDGPRYKAMGNSMAVPVIAWIGRRIEAFDTLHGDEVGLNGPPAE